MSWYGNVTYSSSDIGIELGLENSWYSKVKYQSNWHPQIYIGWTINGNYSRCTKSMAEEREDFVITNSHTKPIARETLWPDHEIGHLTGIKQSLVYMDDFNKSDKVSNLIKTIVVLETHAITGPIHKQIKLQWDSSNLKLALDPWPCTRDYSKLQL